MKFIKLIWITIILFSPLFSCGRKPGSGHPLAIKYPVHKHVTPAKGDLNGNLMSLSSHMIYCNKKEALQSFGLLEPSRGMISYNYTCQQHEAVQSDAYETSTKWYKTGRNIKSSTTFLDRHEVKCKEGYGLQKVKLQTAGKTVRYWFRCARILILDCHAVTNPKTLATEEDGLAKVNLLKNQRIRLDLNQILTGFKLNVIEEAPQDNPREADFPNYKMILTILIPY